MWPLSDCMRGASDDDGDADYDETLPLVPMIVVDPYVPGDSIDADTAAFAVHDSAVATTTASALPSDDALTADPAGPYEPNLVRSRPPGLPELSSDEEDDTCYGAPEGSYRRSGPPLLTCEMQNPHDLELFHFKLGSVIHAGPRGTYIKATLTRDPSRKFALKVLHVVQTCTQFPIHTHTLQPLPTLVVLSAVLPRNARSTRGRVARRRDREIQRCLR